MWLFFVGGFVSIVQKTGESRICVRARAAADLDAFREGFCPRLTPTTWYGGSDYPCRAYVGREDLAEALAAVARSLSAPNFKNAVARTQGEGRAKIYGRLWQELLAIEAEKPPRRARPSKGREGRPAPRKGPAAGGDGAGEGRDGG